MERGGKVMENIPRRRKEANKYLNKTKQRHGTGSINSKKQVIQQIQILLGKVKLNN